jgi:hypothetical protein
MNVIVKPWWGLETCCDSRSEEMGLSAVIAISALFGFWTWRKQRRTGYRAWYYGRGKKVDRARRSRIARAVRRGKAVSDPRDAALAVEMIDAQQKLTNLTDRSGWKQGSITPSSRCLSLPSQFRREETSEPQVWRSFR